MSAVVRMPHPLTNAMLQAEHDVDRRLIRVLYDSRPHRMTVWKVMLALGMEPDSYQGHRQERQFQAYLALSISRARVAQILSRHGFELQRSGGTINDEIWLEPQRASPSN